MGDDDYTISISDSPTIVFDSMNTITLGSSDTVDTFQLGDILKNTSYKPYKDPNETVLNYIVSPLAVILQLLENGRQTWEIVDAMHVESVTNLKVSDDNIKLADEIKEYYRAKIITDTLSSKRRRSDYRSDLIMALALLDMCQTKRSFMPMLIKLPSFYNEDIKLEKLTSEYKSVSSAETDSGNVSEFKVVTLNLVDQVKVDRRHQKVHQFYFTDSDGYLYSLATELKNSLIPFLSVIASRPITLRCRVKPLKHKFYNFNFYSILDKFEVLEI